MKKQKQTRLQTKKGSNTLSKDLIKDDGKLDTRWGTLRIAHNRKKKKFFFFIFFAKSTWRALQVFPIPFWPHMRRIVGRTNHNIAVQFQAATRAQLQSPFASNCASSRQTQRSKPNSVFGPTLSRDAGAPPDRRGWSDNGPVARNVLHA